ncbi:MAG: hypothetical protein JWO58_215 [Chitinophagaceae bacterium]|nr:hypothetical protein [Chitinophagaceae bacterium]
MIKKLLTLLFLFSSLLMNAQGWSQLGTGTYALTPSTAGEIHSIVAANGMVYAAGYFKNAGGFYYVAQWDGMSWSELGSGSDALNANQIISQICADPSGNIYAAGNFTDASGYIYVAKWDGTSWSEVGVGVDSLKVTGGIGAICSDQSGNIYAAGAFDDANGKSYVAKWNGSTWSELGTGSHALNGNDIIWNITSDANGNIYAAGDFKDAAGKTYVAKWDGTDWSELGTGTNALKANYFIYTVYVDPSGNVYAAGGFTDDHIETDYTYLVVKWDGTSWTKVGTGGNGLMATGSILSMISDNDGMLYIAGFFSNSNSERYVAKWDGTNWSELGTSIGSQLHANSYIDQICADTDGNIYAAGNFKDANSKRYVARYSTAIPTATKSITHNDSFSIYPNPTTGMAYINSSYKGQAKVYDHLGQLISTQFIDSENTALDLNGVKDGVYIIFLTNEEQTYSPIKLIKK